MSCNSATATDSPPPVNKGHEANDLTVRKSPTDEIVVHTNDGSDDSDVEYFHDEVHDPILPHEEQITEPKDELNDRELNSTECLIQAVSLPQTKHRRYVNQGGNFITGFDVSSEEAADRRAQRAQRFGITSSKSEDSNKLHDRGKRFGIQPVVIDGEVARTVKMLPETSIGDIRSEAIHLHGTNEMSTEDVFDYFSLYGPSCVEWINDSSCNAVWEDTTSAKRAFFGKGKHPVIAEADVEEYSKCTDSSVLSTLYPWRLGETHHRSNQLLLRFATVSDVKEKGASNKSQYYKKYGNPNIPSINRNKKDLRSRLNRKRSAAQNTPEEEEKQLEIANEGEEVMKSEVQGSPTAMNKSLYSDSSSSVVGARHVHSRLIKKHKNNPEDEEEEEESLVIVTSNDLRHKLKYGRKKLKVKDRLGICPRPVS